MKLSKKKKREKMKEGESKLLSQSLRPKMNISPIIAPRRATAIKTIGIMPAIVYALSVDVVRFVDTS